MTTLTETIAALEPLVAGKPHAMLGLARMMQEDGQSAKALDLCHSALRLAPEDGKLAAKITDFITRTVPGWHFYMLRDEMRIAAYDAALRRAVTSESRVLEIGTGTGILAMMAARAGARSVVTCEMTPAIATQAAAIIAQNGYADRVRVVAKHLISWMPKRIWTGAPIFWFRRLSAIVLSTNLCCRRTSTRCGICSSRKGASFRLAAPCGWHWRTMPWTFKT